jgi:hypothetical protein
VNVLGALADAREPDGIDRLPEDRQREPITPSMPRTFRPSSSSAFTTAAT